MTTLPQDLSTKELWALLGLDEEELLGAPDKFQVHMRSAGLYNIYVIKEIRSLIGLGLKAVKELVESAPVDLPRLLSFREALRWVYQLKSVGADCCIRGLSQSCALEIAVQVALHPKISLLLVQFLLTNGAREINEALAKNPHLHGEMLSSIARVAPESFLENPLLPLLFLEDPNLLQLDDAAITALMERPNTPAALYPVALQRDAASKLLASRDPTALPEGVLEMLAQSNLPSVQKALANNPKTPLWVLERLAEVDDDYILLDLPDHPNTTPELLRKLSAREDAEVIAAVARSRVAPAELLRELSLRTDNEILEALASNPNTPEEIILMLAKQHGRNLHPALGYNPRLPLSLVQSFIGANDHNALSGISQVGSTEALRLLLRSNVASRHKLAALKSPNCTWEILQIAEGDQDGHVRAEAQRRLQDVAKSEGGHLVMGVGAHAKQPPAVDREET